MKQIILLFIFACFHWTLSAQMNIGVEPSPVYGEGSVNDFDIAAHGILKNNETESHLLRWRRIEVDMPAEWSTWVCDNNLCYGPMVSVTPDAFPMELAGETGGTMDVHVDPSGVAGTGTVKLEITLFNDTTVVLDTAIFIFEVGLTSTADLNAPAQIKVFPNPTSNFISLSGDENIDQIVIYNVVGRKVRDFTVAEGRRYPVADLPNGIYMLSLLSRKSGIVKTLRLSKK